jgi:Na+-transporting NADH:ubiquinone oxidoreductase subunit NqrF
MGASNASDQFASGGFCFISTPTQKQASLDFFIKQKSRSKLRDYHYFTATISVTRDCLFVLFQARKSAVPQLIRKLKERSEKIIS